MKKIFLSIMIMVFMAACGESQQARQLDTNGAQAIDTLDDFLDDETREVAEEIKEEAADSEVSIVEDTENRNAFTIEIDGITASVEYVNSEGVAITVNGYEISHDLLKDTDKFKALLSELLAPKQSAVGAMFAPKAHAFFGSILGSLAMVLIRGVVNYVLKETKIGEVVGPIVEPIIDPIIGPGGPLEEAIGGGNNANIPAPVSGIFDAILDLFGGLFS